MDTTDGKKFVSGFQVRMCLPRCVVFQRGRTRAVAAAVEEANSELSGMERSTRTVT